MLNSYRQYREMLNTYWYYFATLNNYCYQTPMLKFKPTPEKNRDCVLVTEMCLRKTIDFSLPLPPEGGVLLSIERDYACALPHRCARLTGEILRHAIRRLLSASSHSGLTGFTDLVTSAGPHGDAYRQAQQNTWCTVLVCSRCRVAESAQCRLEGTRKEAGLSWCEITYCTLQMWGKPWQNSVG